MSFARYERYKDSGVEWLCDVPTHWEVKPLKTITSFNDDVLPESTDLEESIEYVDISSVSVEKGIEKAEPMQFGNAPSRARRKVRDGDVIVSTVRTYLKAIAPIYQPPENLVVSTGFAVIRPRAGFCPGFARYSLQSGYFMDEVISRSVGISYPAINASDMAAIHLVTPPIEEQSAIAAFLDRETAKIDALVAEQQRLIELLKEKRQTVISHAVTKGLNPDAPMKDSGIEWLGEVPGHWEVKCVKHVMRSIEQGWSPQCESFPVETSEEWGVLKVGCVNGGTFNPNENKTLPTDLEPLPVLGIFTDDLLISRANTPELVGSAAVVERDYPNLLLCDKLYRIRLNSECLPMFLVRYLGVDKVRGQLELAATGASSSMQNIAQSTILNLALALPPPEEQFGIAAFLDREAAKFDELTAEAQRGIPLLLERRTALISAAVTGKIDVHGFENLKEVA